MMLIAGSIGIDVKSAPTKTQEETLSNLVRATPATRTYTWWFHIIKGLVRVSRNHARNLGYKCPSKEDRP